MGDLDEQHSGKTGSKYSSLLFWVCKKKDFYLLDKNKVMLKQVDVPCSLTDDCKGKNNVLLTDFKTVVPKCDWTFIADKRDSMVSTTLKDLVKTGLIFNNNEEAQYLNSLICTVL